MGTRVHSGSLPTQTSYAADLTPQNIFPSLKKAHLFHHNYLYFCNLSKHPHGLGSSVGIVTELQAGRSGIESRWGRDFPPVQTGPGAHPASCKMGTGSFQGVKCGRGVLLTTHPLLVPRSGRVELHLYPPSGPRQACNGITLLLPLLYYGNESLTNSSNRTQKPCF